MPATAPHMFAIVRPDGYGRPQCISLPFVGCLLAEPDSPQRYYLLSPEPPHAPEPRRSGNFGPRPRRNGKELTPLKD